MDPWLTVITVIKDAPGELASTVSSLLSQDLSGVEYVVVDSSSETAPVLHALEQIEHAYLWVEPTGVYSAMNVGLHRARGTYLYFANAGDVFFHPDTVANVRESVLQSRPLWAYGEIEIISRSGRHTITPKWDYNNELRNLFGRGKFPPHQATFAQRELVRHLGGFDVSYRVAADYALALRMSQVSQPLYLDQTVATFREGGLSTKAWRAAQWEFHRARCEVFNPHGSTRLREFCQSAQQFAAAAVFRGLTSWTVRE